MEVEKIRLYTNANDDESGFIENETGLNRDDTEETEISLIRQDVELIKSVTNTGDTNPEIVNKTNTNQKKIDTEPTQPTTSGYKRKFIWPDNFLNRESRKETEPLEPIKPKDIGKQSTRPFFGQVIETLGPRLNSNEQKFWNLEKSRKNNPG